MKLIELGIDGAVQYFRQQIMYFKNNHRYENSWIYCNMCEMSLEYIVNDLAE